MTATGAGWPQMSKTSAAEFVPGFLCEMLRIVDLDPAPVVLQLECVFVSVAGLSLKKGFHRGCV
jgi:hypothetical protein